MLENVKFSGHLFGPPGSNHVFGSAIWDKFSECIFENFEIFKIFKNHDGDLSQKSPETNMWLLVNHTKPVNTMYWN